MFKSLTYPLPSLIDQHLMEDYYHQYRWRFASQHWQGILAIGTLFLQETRLQLSSRASIGLHMFEAHFRLRHYEAARVCVAQALQQARQAAHIPLQTRALICLSACYRTLAASYVSIHIKHIALQLSYHYLHLALQLVKQHPLDDTTKAGVYYTAGRFYCEQLNHITIGTLYYQAAMDLCHPLHITHHTIATRYIQCLLTYGQLERATSEMDALQRRSEGADPTGPITQLHQQFRTDIETAHRQRQDAPPPAPLMRDEAEVQLRQQAAPRQPPPPAHRHPTTIHTAITVWHVAAREETMRRG